MELILASQSPRRSKMLKDLGYNFTTIPSDFDEASVEFSDPLLGVEDLAKGKAMTVFGNLSAESKSNSIVLGADTIVMCDGKVLLKPRSENEAIETLEFLSGKVHQVYTAVAFVSAVNTESFVSKTDVYFYDLTSQEIIEYVATGEPMDKAGAYGIQGKGCTLVRKIDGDYYNVVGLPLPQVVRHLTSLDVFPRKD